MTTLVPNLLQSPVALRLLRMCRPVTIPVIGVPAQPIRLALLLIGTILRIADHLTPLPSRLPGLLAFLLPTVTLILLTRTGNKIFPASATRYLLHNHHNYSLLMVMVLKAGIRKTKGINKNEMDWISKDGNNLTGHVGPVTMAPFYPGETGLESNR